MGIYIKNMGMPKEGCYHRICIYPDGAVPIEGGMYEAIHVPPHGRLIDADDIENITVIMNENGSGFNRIVAPTVIPAEPPKEET